ncbi:MAG: hypothetical protein WA705_27865 [Candidatus Ozemobacteraceae bacterium]
MIDALERAESPLDMGQTFLGSDQFIEGHPLLGNAGSDHREIVQAAL